MTEVVTYPVAEGRCPCCGALPKAHWTPARMVAAAIAHQALTGLTPTQSAWSRSTADHPSAGYARIMFGTWARFLGAAGMQPGVFWTETRIVEAIQRWSAEHGGKPPTARQWWRVGTYYPTAQTVAARFGSWNNGLEAAGFWRRGNFGAVLVGRTWEGPRGDASHRRRGEQRKQAVAA